MLNKLLTSKNKPRAIIFCEKKFSAIDHVINQYIKSIISEDFNKEDDNCKKIDNGTYCDLIIFDGNKQTIKKDDINYIRNQFLYSPFEKCGKRIYVLKNVNNSTTEAMNSLLKFMEEPPQSTYAILTTKNISSVLPTIKSRCQIFHLSSNLNDFENRIKKFDLDKNQKNIVQKVYFDFEEFKEDYDNGLFNQYYCFTNKLIKNYKNLSTIKELSVEFSKMDYNNIKKILYFLCVLIENKKKEIVLMINNLNLYPSKILVFNQLWEMLDE